MIIVTLSNINDCTIFTHSFVFILCNKTGRERNTIRLSQPPTQAIIDAYKSNLLLGAETLLVLFLYNNLKEMRLFRMHPEMLQADTIHDTNKGGKELFNIGSLDSNNRAFNAGRAYISNAQRWVFTIIFKECLSHFWPHNNGTKSSDALGKFR